MGGPGGSAPRLAFFRVLGLAKCDFLLQNVLLSLPLPSVQVAAAHSETGEREITLTSERAKWTTRGQARGKDTGHNATTSQNASVAQVRSVPHEERGSVADVAASERATASLRAAELQTAEPCSELQN